MHRTSFNIGSIPVAAAMLLLAVAPPIVRAQAVASASLTGRVLDESGAPVPDVTVSVTSPALQISSVTAAVCRPSSMASVMSGAKKPMRIIRMT